MSTLHHESILEDLYDNSLYDQQLLKEFRDRFQLDIPDNKLEIWNFINQMKILRK